MQPASISFAICGLRRIIIVFSLFQTNKMENGKNGNGNGGSPFFGDFFFLGDLDQQNIVETAYFPEHASLLKLS